MFCKHSLVCVNIQMRPFTKICPLTLAYGALDFAPANKSNTRQNTIPLRVIPSTLSDHRFKQFWFLHERWRGRRRSRRQGLGNHAGDCSFFLKLFLLFPFFLHFVFSLYHCCQLWIHMQKFAVKENSDISQGIRKIDLRWKGITIHDLDPYNLQHKLDSKLSNKRRSSALGREGMKLAGCLKFKITLDWNTSQKMESSREQKSVIIAQKFAVTELIEICR